MLASHNKSMCSPVPHSSACTVWPPARVARDITDYDWRMKYACVSEKHDVIIVSDGNINQLNVHALADGAFQRSFGAREWFKFRMGGMCITPCGDRVLVAGDACNWVAEFHIATGRFSRKVNQSALQWPQYVDCNAAMIAVSQSGMDCVTLLTWPTGRTLHVLRRGGSPLRSPRGVCLLSNGAGLVVADCCNDRLCLFANDGTFVRTLGDASQGLCQPMDVLECCGDGGDVIVANSLGHNLLKVSRDGRRVSTFGSYGKGSGKFRQPTALARLPDGGLLVLESSHHRLMHQSQLSFYPGVNLRLDWIRVCVVAARSCHE